MSPVPDAGDPALDPAPARRETAGSLPQGRFTKPEAARARLLAVTSTRPAGEASEVVAWLAGSLAERGSPAVSVEVTADGSRPAAGPFSTEASRGLVELVTGRLPWVAAVPRGGVCHVALSAGEGLGGRLAELVEALPSEASCVVAVAPGNYREVIEGCPTGPDSVVIRADLAADRPVVGLACAELRERGVPAKVWKSPAGGLRGRLARYGIPVGRSNPSLAARMLARLSSLEAAAGRRRGTGGRAIGSTGGLDAADDSGQALPLVLGAVAVLVTAALILVALGGGATGKGRAQRAADLAAVSAARSLRDDLPRRLSPPVVNGAPNPYHLSRAAYLSRSRRAAVRAGTANGVSPLRLRVRFPDWASPAPLRAKVVVRGTLSVRVADARRRAPVRASATAAATVPLPVGGGSGAGRREGTAMASGGGYSGPLSIRQGKGMRPDVAQAFDALAGAAAAAGHHLTVTSAFRSDAEQARLFAANPDPRWVAPPGESLHRCATELDLGPESAYGWLAANAPRFGFTKRYSWEDWHFGYTAGPDPCAEGGAGTAAAPDGRLSSAGLPSFVPPGLRDPILRAASRWNVSVSLLAAQLQAESGFDPDAVSPAGAQGVAQFMPATAASYGLADPFDPEQSIMAQAEMMADLLQRFGSTELALAAYNAGPGAVGACDCIPDYPETIAYVERITGLLAGLGEGIHLPLEVRLVS